MKFGDKIRLLREKEKISRDELALKLGLTYHALAKYETNDREPDHETLRKIADFFHVSIDYLLGKKPTKEEVKDIEKIFKSLPLEEQKAFMKKLLDSFMNWQQDGHK